MENIQNNPTIEDPHKNKVHKILAHSYLFYFTTLLIAIFLDLLFPNIKFFTSSILQFLGLFLVLFGTLLIFWAQRSSHKFELENLSKESFCNGPYRYSRSPTHFGLFFLILGFGLVVNIFFVVIFSIISFFITKLVFIKEQERILELKYGEPYREYKKIVRI